MKNLFLMITSVLLLSSISTQVQARSLVQVVAIGSSPKGQFVAFEEFGYQNGKKNPFSKIRVMNMWKNKYVTKPVFIIGAHEDDKLRQIRLRAKTQAVTYFKKFDISL